MASFTQVRYGSRFPTFQSDNLNSNKARSGYTAPSYVNSPGAGPYSLASLMGQTNPKPAPVSTNVTAGSTANPSDTAKQGVAAAKPFTPPDAGALATDPILMQIRDLGQRNVQDARTGALGAAENALIGYGDVGQVPSSLKDLYASDNSNPIYQAFLDANTAQAAKANPDSTLNLLSGEHTRNNAGIDESTNAQNLYYSSTHANQLGDEATGYRQRQSQAAQSLAQLLGGANQGVLDAQQNASNQYLGELPNAYQRATQLAQLLGGDPTAGDTGGTTPPGGDTTLGLPNEPQMYFNPLTGKWESGTPQTGPRVGY